MRGHASILAMEAIAMAAPVCHWHCAAMCAGGMDHARVARGVAFPRSALAALGTLFVRQDETTAWRALCFSTSLARARARR